MRTSWVVQSNIPNSDSAELLRVACLRAGRPYIPMAIVAEQPDLGDVRPPLVFHGLSTLVLRAAEGPRANQGVFYDAAAFSHDAYANGFGASYLNYDASVMDWPTLIEMSAESQKLLFIKPVDDLKAFTGHVAGHAGIVELHRWLSERRRLSTTVVVGQPHEVDAEWRLFVVDGEVVAGSMYRPTADPYIPEDLLAFAGDCIGRWAPAAVYVLDIGRVEVGWRVIECNCFNWCRFYRSDVPRIVDRVSRYQESHC